MFLSKLFIEFMVFSFIGWIYECTYCTVKEGHWQNRGFLFGPICPIYGTGTVLTELIFLYLPFFKNTPPDQIQLWKIFLICSVGSIFLEYGTSYILEKRFHAVWWDYNDMPLSINGRICVPATLGFGVAGILVTRFVFPLTIRFRAVINPNLAEFLSLLLMAYLAADLVLTVSSLYHLLSMVENIMSEFDVRMEGAFQTAAATPAKAKETITAMPQKAKEMALSVPTIAREALSTYEERMKEKVNMSISRLDFRQKYQLKNIKGFRFRRPVFRSGTNINTEKMSDFYNSLQDKIKQGK
jgi:uncharacterized membrane protein